MRGCRDALRISWIKTITFLSPFFINFSEIPKMSFYTMKFLTSISRNIEQWVVLHFQKLDLLRKKSKISDAYCF